MKVATAGVLALALAASGCASITRGTSENVTIDSKPRGAAVTTSIGLDCPSTPCTIKASRNKSFVATATKRGYGKGEIEVKTKLSKDGVTKMAGNIILPGGTAGAVIDVVSGAGNDHVPNPAVIVLKRTGSGGKVHARHRARRAPTS